MSSTLPVQHLHLDLRPGAPAMIRVPFPGDAVAWAGAHRPMLRSVVAEHGAVLVRGLGLRDPAQVGAVFGQLATHLMAEREAFAARRAYGGGVYSSSTWPANQPMCMHHELSYAQEFPSTMLFACLRPPQAGGATGVADAARVLDALPAGLVARFAHEGWLLVRNYHAEIGASVGDAFGTEDRAAVERYCRAHAIGYEWRPGGGLRTWQRRRAVVRHPVTGLRCWFNQVAFLNEATMEPEVREFLVDTYGPDGLPFTTRFGGGEPIGADVVALINGVYERHTVREPWQEGDLMLVDNVRAAHGREAFSGPREVLVAMADAVSFR
ncbi:MAG: TauD/TfdA family dioxygenase [Pseudonocardia sp.]